MEVTQNYMSQSAGLKRFFNNFLVRRMMIDHTFSFPRMIWTFASFVLIAFGFSPWILLLSYLLIYALYVFVAVVNYVSVCILLKKYPAEEHYYVRLWWVTLTLPIYMFICSWIRLIGIINAMTTKASWKLRGINTEMAQIKDVIKDDVETVKEQRRKDRGE
jgi:hypothetical protein